MQSLYSYANGNLFQCFKGRGFRFENTHVNAIARLEKIMALMALTFCWAHKVGEWRADHQLIPLKRHRDSTRLQYSYFRYGLDWLQEVISGPLKNTLTQWHLCLQQLQFSNDLQLIEPSS